MLISENYRNLQRELHENPDYGVASVGYAPLVASVLEKFQIGELLDYGAGKGRLFGALEQCGYAGSYRPYEPARDEWASLPTPHDAVACIDVLEHIEPECLDAVLDDLKRVTRKIGVFTVHTGPAVKKLSDGRNAHLVQQPPEWWLPRFFSRFDVIAFQKMPQGFFVIVGVKQ